MPWMWRQDHFGLQGAPFGEYKCTVDDFDHAHQTPAAYSLALAGGEESLESSKVCLQIT